MSEMNSMLCYIPMIPLHCIEKTQVLSMHIYSDVNGLYHKVFSIQHLIYLWNWELQVHDDVHMGM